jgi:hypothetical protein
MSQRADIHLETLVPKLRWKVFTFYFHSVEKKQGRKLLVALVPTANKSGLYHGANKIFHAAHLFEITHSNLLLNARLPGYILSGIKDLEIKLT